MWKNGVLCINWGIDQFTWIRMANDEFEQLCQPASRWRRSDKIWSDNITCIWVWIRIFRHSRGLYPTIPICSCGVFQHIFCSPSNGPGNHGTGISYSEQFRCSIGRTIHQRPGTERHAVRHPVDCCDRFTEYDYILSHNVQSHNSQH